ncbi:MAG: hypothetical protein ASARMPREDX12_008392 [Alectoria sarmentosa]|nr:MAG: hypothetical protein ASARMPREDX12_008392 [Alectoria sarmentosa]
MEEDNPKLTYLGDYAELPIDAPVGHPHLVDPDSVDEEFTQEDLTVADLVVTILFKFMPEALTAFLDLNRPKVHYIQGGSSRRLDFCIKRNNRLVIIGFLNEKALGGWDLQYQYRIKGKATEMWTPVSMSAGDGHKVIDAEKIVQGAPGSAFSIFQHEPWRPAQEMEWLPSAQNVQNFRSQPMSGRLPLSAASSLIIDYQIVSRRTSLLDTANHDHVSSLSNPLLKSRSISVYFNKIIYSDAYISKSINAAVFDVGTQYAPDLTLICFAPNKGPPVDAKLYADLVHHASDLEPPISDCVGDTLDETASGQEYEFPVDEPRATLDVIAKRPRRGRPLLRPKEDEELSPERSKPRPPRRRRIDDVIDYEQTEAAERLIDDVEKEAAADVAMAVNFNLDEPL